MVSSLLPPSTSPPCLCLSCTVCHQDETAEGVWGSDAQYRDDQHQTTVVPQLGTQDLHAVSSYMCVAAAAEDADAALLNLLTDTRPPPLHLEAAMLLETKVQMTTVKS